MVNKTEPPAVSCPCKACIGMRKMYGKDADLLEFYGRKLLQRGWAGKTDPVEQAYRRAYAKGGEAAAVRGEQLAAQANRQRADL